MVVEYCLIHRIYTKLFNGTESFVASLTHQVNTLLSTNLCGKHLQAIKDSFGTLTYVEMLTLI